MNCWLQKCGNGIHSGEYELKKVTKAVGLKFPDEMNAGVRNKALLKGNHYFNAKCIWLCFDYEEC